MHKITKGLKKKKKGKKSKRKDEELFKPEELEAYRQQHQQQQQQQEAEENQEKGGEEWRKFLNLTHGVDDILKKTQDDLDRIKSTSFFKRIPTASEVQKQKEVEEAAAAAAAPPPEQVEVQPTQEELGIVQVSESEEEDEDEDDIFDTAYIDALAAGEVKLAYIPESPTEETGDDPFDTSYAERAILGPVVTRKGKKLVTLGSAVEVLTGRVVLPTCATQRPTSRRQILKERDLLLESFDDNANTIPSATSPEEVKKTLLDDDEPIPLADEPIDLSKTLHPITPVEPATVDPKKNTLVEEFDVIKAKTPDDEDDKDFALLAAESLSKTVTVINTFPKSVAAEDGNWAVFDQPLKADKLEQEEEEQEVDPFDTTFAENVFPGKAELKIIENEILNEDFDFDPRAELSDIISKVAIQINDSERNSVSSVDRIPEGELNLIKPIHRDLLGGSNTDLSNFDQPLRPSEKIEEDYIEYCDPFDTSIVETVKLPGTTELKFLERELLGDIKAVEEEVEEDFNPRAVPKERSLSRPDVLNVSSNKTVSFDVPSPPRDLLSNSEETARTVKPLTPFYVRKQSIPEEVIPELEIDPFDTSFASDIKPGKVELKVIENELFDPLVEHSLNIADQDFDPRDENKVKIESAVQSIKEIIGNRSASKSTESAPIDLLAVEHNDDTVKVLTPNAQSLEEISYKDPFDTSAIVNILPGKAELKLLESELLLTQEHQKLDCLLDESGDAVIAAPLKPIPGNSLDFDDDIDPFDTSIANNIVPGKAELKVLESELL